MATAPNQNGMDPATAQMLAQPEFLTEPVFSKEHFLAQAAASLLGQYLVLTKNAPNASQQVQQAYADSNSNCLKVTLGADSGKPAVLVAWTYDLDARGPDGALGRDVWVERSNKPDKPVVNSTTNRLLEQVLWRRVVRIQVASDKKHPQPLGDGDDYQICQLKNLGWYIAGLVPPTAQSCPPKIPAGYAVGAVSPGGQIYPPANAQGTVAGSFPAVGQICQVPNVNRHVAGSVLPVPKQLHQNRKLMKAAGMILALLVGVALIFALIRVADNSIAPLFLNSRLERLGEKDLPRITIERGGIVYCRMKADDFRFPLPSGSQATNLVVTGGFDTVDGNVEARFEGTNQVTASEYESSLSGKVQVGGQITARTIPGGLLIQFHYFGDR
jgi:hypothetical protein